MTSSNWRAGSNDRTRVVQEAAAKVLDHQATLRLSAVEAEPSSQLRARVLTSFEERIERKSSLWTWLVPATAAAMVAVVVIALGYWRLRVPRPPTSLPTAANRIVDVRPVAPSPQAQVAHPRRDTATRLRKQGRPPQRLEAQRAVASSDLPVAQFDSLLYCDPFSCGDPMQVIRLEMPAASVGRAYRPLARNGFVNAEVIVGTDGLTRAVRFTK